MIIFEDNHLLVVNKDPGALSQGDKTGDDTLIDRYKDYIKEKYNKPGNVFLHPVHRLDRPVGGCFIMAKTSKSLSRLTKMFREGSIKKMYFAIVDHLPTENEQRLEHYLVKNTNRNISRVVGKNKKGAKKSVMDYKLISVKNGKALIVVEPKTGRSHQIRVQLSYIGSPILGDQKYGGSKGLNSKSIYLHCAKMELIHPVKKEPMIFSALPFFDRIWKTFENEINQLLS